METKIQAIHFDIAESLTAFINKKADKLARKHINITEIAATLKVVKPETAMNKEARLSVTIPQHDDIVATKTANSFEEAIDLCIAAIEPQLEKLKDKK